MKKIFFVIFICLVSFTFSMRLNAISGYTTGTYIRVRKGPGVNYDFLYQIDEINSSLEVLNTTLENVGDSNCSGGWYKISYNNKEGYACANYISIGEKPSSSEGYSTVTYEARINGIDVGIRTSANSSSTKQDYPLLGTNVTILGDKVSGSGCSNGWYKIRYYGSKTGYVCSDYVVIKNQITSSDADYEAYLKTLGFTDSYIPYLVYMHKNHPKWKFNAINTGLYWDNVIEGESYSNYIQSTDAAYVKNLTQAEVGGWYYAKDSVIAYYMDPRNFLNEKYVFMFENLNYNYGSGKGVSLNKEDDITKFYYNTITNLASGRYLNTDDYKYKFIDAGWQYNISPIHLVARVIQEGAGNEGYGSISGDYTTRTGLTYNYYKNGVIRVSYNLDGYYNFYNIGAYADSNTNYPIVRGLAYACGSKCEFYDTYNRPWNTKEKAIYGGANQIAAGYIADGQNTLYFEKFNTSPSSSGNPYTHQYQTNILAPASEGSNAYFSYKDLNLLNEEFTFDIPVYKNMPEVISLPGFESTINTLSDIKIDGKSISGFDSDILTYTVYLSSDKTMINIEATKTDAGSKISGVGKLEISSKEMEHSITVTSESGTNKTYKIKFVKVSNATSIDDILKNLSVKVNNNVMYSISPSTTLQTLTNSILKYSPGATITYTDQSNKAVNASGVIKTGYQLKLVAPSSESRVFTLSVIGDTSGDGEITILDLLKVQKHLLNSSKLSGVYLTSGDTNADSAVTILDLLRIKKAIMKEIKL